MVFLHPEPQDIFQEGRVRPVRESKFHDQLDTFAMQCLYQIFKLPVGSRTARIASLRCVIPGPGISPVIDLRIRVNLRRSLFFACFSACCLHCFSSFFFSGICMMARAALASLSGIPFRKNQQFFLFCRRPACHEKRSPSRSPSGSTTSSCFCCGGKCRLTEDLLSNNPASWYNKTSFYEGGGHGCRIKHTLQLT